jgi:hypothetical protein
MRHEMIVAPFLLKQRSLSHVREWRSRPTIFTEESTSSCVVLVEAVLRSALYRNSNHFARVAPSALKATIHDL